MVDVFELLEKYGSPLYVYDYRRLREKCKDITHFCQKIMNQLDNKVKVAAHYSAKANLNPEILKIIEEFGLNVQCMSPFEVEVCEVCGFDVDRILYVCNAISAEEMELIHEKGILICLDSISQLEMWARMFPGTDIMLRINPTAEGRFGITKKNIPLARSIADKYSLNIVGVHQHFGSVILNDKIPDYLEWVKAGVSLIAKYFSDVEIVDFGGGFGIPDKEKIEVLHLSVLADGLQPILEELLAECSNVQEIIFEPGRYITGESGVLIGEVNAIKHESDTWWIETNIGINQLSRSTKIGENFDVDIVLNCNKKFLTVDGKSLLGVTATICGNSGDANDIIAVDKEIAELPIAGDVVIIYNVGAYGYSMASNYTGRPRPAEVLVNRDKDMLIRNAETVGKMMEGVVLI